MAQSNDATENESHVLVERAFELIGEILEQNEISQEDMENVYDALNDAYTHPDSDIWVTITALGPKNQVLGWIQDEKMYQNKSARDVLSGIYNHEIEITVS